MSETRSVAAIGISNDRRKYGNKAVRAFRNYVWQRFLTNAEGATVEHLPTFRFIEACTEVLHLLVTTTGYGRRQNVTPFFR